MDDLLAVLADIGFAMQLIRKRYATKDDVAALRGDMGQINVPERISQLDNDAGYQTAADVDVRDAAITEMTQAAVTDLRTSITDTLGSLPTQKSISLTIPTTGWLNTDSECYCDIDVLELTADTIPEVSVDEAYETAALDCAILHCCQSRAGKLRVFAADIPTEPIPITLTFTQRREI